MRVWPQILGRLKRLLEKGDVSAKDKLMFALSAPMTGMFAKKVEN